MTLIDAKLVLRTRFSLPDQDRVYAFDTSGTVEDLVTFWQRMVKVDYNASSGLMELTIYAFTPQDAQDIAAAVLEESNKIINNLSAIAREDSTRFARETLENARARATDARSALATFRQNNKVADPTADITSQMGVVNSLQQQLATALVELDLIRANGKANDPRIVQLERRITAIEGRIDQERSNLGVGANGAGFAEVLSEYERLNVEKSFAEQTYLAALAGFDDLGVDDDVEKPVLHHLHRRLAQEGVPGDAGQFGVPLVQIDDDAFAVGDAHRVLGTIEKLFKKIREHGCRRKNVRGKVTAFSPPVPSVKAGYGHSRELRDHGRHV